MRWVRWFCFGSSVLLCSLTTQVALAHVSMSGPGFAGERQVLTFSVGHGCEGADTYRLEIDIPEEVTTVRPMPSVLGDSIITTSAAGAVTQVAWEKKSVRAADDQYYEVALRIEVPNKPFSTLFFPATQYCRTKDGEERKVAWNASPEEVAAAGEGEEVEPSPSLLILPARVTGWNKYKVDTKITDLSVFDDAQIVWVGDAAYSKNPETMALIEAEDDVSVLTKIEKGAEVWVKY